jgi:hypothetical protein
MKPCGPIWPQLPLWPRGLSLGLIYFAALLIYGAIDFALFYRRF